MGRVTHHVSGPFVGLTLRVDEERPAARELHDDPILYGQVVLGQTSDLPAADADRVAHGGDQVGVLRARDIILVQLSDPELGHAVPVVTLAGKTATMIRR